MGDNMTKGKWILLLSGLVLFALLVTSATTQWRSGGLGLFVDWAELSSTVQDSVQARTDSSNVAGWLFFPKYVCHGTDQFGTSVTADTVENAAITTGDVVIVSPATAGLAPGTYLNRSYVLEDTVVVEASGAQTGAGWSYIILRP